MVVGDENRYSPFPQRWTVYCSGMDEERTLRAHQYFMIHPILVLGVKDHQPKLLSVTSTALTISFANSAVCSGFSNFLGKGLHSLTTVYVVSFDHGTYRPLFEFFIRLSTMLRLDEDEWRELLEIYEIVIRRVVRDFLCELDFETFSACEHRQHAKRRKERSL
jgi:hypothetical protein